MDESEKDGLFVIAGFIATAENWAKFAYEWERLCRRFGRVDSRGNWYFHMTEQQGDPNLLEYLPAFFETIADYVHACIATVGKVQDFKNADSRIVIWKNGRRVRNSGIMRENRYLYFLITFLISFHQSDFFRDIFTFDFEPDKIDFIFDERGEKKKILPVWDGFVANAPFPEKFGKTPRFEDDKEFMPLQAADIIAWWIRNNISKGCPVKESVWVPWEQKKLVHCIINVQEEDSIFENFKNYLVTRYPDIDAVYDLSKLFNVTIPALK
jgi:hypothetical protein